MDCAAAAHGARDGELAAVAMEQKAAAHAGIDSNRDAKLQDNAVRDVQKEVVEEASRPTPSRRPSSSSAMSPSGAPPGTNSTSS